MGKTGKMFKIIASGFKSPSKENLSKEKTTSLSSKKTDKEQLVRAFGDFFFWGAVKIFYFFCDFFHTELPWFLLHVLLIYFISMFF